MDKNLIKRFVKNDKRINPAPNTLISNGGVLTFPGIHASIAIV